MRYTSLLCATAIVVVSALSASAQTPAQAPALSTKPMSNPPAQGGRPDPGHWNNTSVPAGASAGRIAARFGRAGHALRTGLALGRERATRMQRSTPTPPRPRAGSDLLRLQLVLPRCGQPPRAREGRVRAWIVDRPAALPVRRQRSGLAASTPTDAPAARRARFGRADHAERDLQQQLSVRAIARLRHDPGRDGARAAHHPDLQEQGRREVSPRRHQAVVRRLGRLV
jgi:hypothetical protein